MGVIRPEMGHFPRRERGQLAWFHRAAASLGPMLLLPCSGSLPALALALALECHYKPHAPTQLLLHSHPPATATSLLSHLPLPLLHLHLPASHSCCIAGTAGLSRFWPGPCDSQMAPCTYTPPCTAIHAHPTPSLTPQLPSPSHMP